MAQAQPAVTQTDIRALIPDVPEVLEFESWWNERGGQKRYMLLLYFPAVGQFQVLCDDSKVPLVITICKRGEPLQAWDLHVGATVDVFGRSTTLMSATMRTIQWLDDTARHLWKLKEAAEKRLNKFRPKSHVDLDYGMFKVLSSNRASACLGGAINVGKIARTVIQLERELAQFQ